MPEYSIKELESRMTKAIEVLKNQLSSVRTGRASSSLVDQMKVEAYGQNMSIKDLASVSTPEPRVIKINVWDGNLTELVEKCIRNSDLDLNPQTEGQAIRIIIPELTQERRQEYVKMAKNYSEQSKVSIRNIRQDGMNNIKKSSQNSELSEDELKLQSEDIQRLTDSFIEKINIIINAKESEILKI